MPGHVIVQRSVRRGLTDVDGLVIPDFARVLAILGNALPVGRLVLGREAGAICQLVDVQRRQAAGMNMGATLDALGAVDAPYIKLNSLPRKNHGAARESTLLRAAPEDRPGPDEDVILTSVVKSHFADAAGVGNRHVCGLSQQDVLALGG